MKKGSIHFDSRRRQILDFIRSFVDEKGYAPSLREIRRACNIGSMELVQHHLEALERDGYISRHPNTSRSITLGERERTSVRVPVLGYIAAGQPIEVPQADAWYQEPVEVMDLPQNFLPATEGVFALIVKGLSMIDALIDDGDTVIMQSATTVGDGEMAAVWLKKEQEVTLKKVYREPDGRIRLQPANREMKPLFCRPDKLEIQGKVIGVIRSSERLYPRSNS
jgi:repressor LexA